MVYIRLYQSNKRRQNGNKSSKKGEFVTSLNKTKASKEDKLVTKVAKKQVLLPAQRKPKHQEKTNW